MQGRVSLLSTFCFLIIVGSCKQAEVKTNSQMTSVEYQREEINVYNQLMDLLLDSVGFPPAANAKLVFYLGDTLAGETNWLREEDLLKENLPTRGFAISDITKSAHKFIRATDTLRLEPGDQFTSRWLKLTRVRFNKDLTNGFLRVGVWCGNMCSWEDSFFIRKDEGKWKIVAKESAPPA